jgi:WXG100 family type VII secretion target
MSFLGGNIDQLQALQTRLQTESQTVEQLQTSLTNLVSGTTWQGPAADRFRNAWTSQYSPNLRQLSTALQELSTEVQRRREALIEVSR